jgi:hypothetical protein
VRNLPQELLLAVSVGVAKNWAVREQKTQRAQYVTTTMDDRLLFLEAAADSLNQAQRKDQACEEAQVKKILTEQEKAILRYGVWCFVYMSCSGAYFFQLKVE